jgi:hypothetical protein
MDIKSNVKCFHTGTIKKIAILLFLCGNLVLGLNSPVYAFQSVITESHSYSNISTFFINDQSHSDTNFIDYVNIGSKSLHLQSDKISNQVVGNANMATTATTAEGIFPLGQSGIAFSSHIGAGVIESIDGSYGANFTDNGIISTAGMGMHFQPAKDSDIRISLAWDHYDIDLNEMYNIPATSDSLSITSIGVTFSF